MPTSHQQSPSPIAPSLQNVLKQVDAIIKGKTLIGHGLKNDFKVIFMTPDRVTVRDTSRYKPFRRANGGRTPSLRGLAEQHLGVKIQTGAHDSIEDARVAMLLYRKVKTAWEAHKLRKLLRKQHKEADKQKKKEKLTVASQEAKAFTESRYFS
jgi:RNA exonuclease 4